MNNVVGSYNALRAAAEHGITRICQASSVNAIGLSYSRTPRFDYFPIDEAHPNYSEDPYSLSQMDLRATGRLLRAPLRHAHCKPAAALGRR